MSSPSEHVLVPPSTPSLVERLQLEFVILRAAYLYFQLPKGEAQVDSAVAVAVASEGSEKVVVEIEPAFVGVDSCRSSC